MPSVQRYAQHAEHHIVQIAEIGHIFFVAVFFCEIGQWANESMISNLLIAIPLFIVSVIFLIGRYYAKITVLNKIALNLKKN